MRLLCAYGMTKYVDKFRFEILRRRETFYPNPTPVSLYCINRRALLEIAMCDLQTLNFDTK